MKRVVVATSRTLGLACWLSLASIACGQTPGVAETTPPGVASPPTAAPTSLTGTWRRLEDAQQRSRRHQAIDQATESLGWLKRNAAREKLRAVTGASSDLKIVDAGGQVTLEVAGRGTTVATDGRSVRLDGPEKSGTVVAVRDRGDLTIKVAGQGGSRTTTYVPSGDGKTLRLDVEMTGSRLATPIRYQATYIRR